LGKFAILICLEAATNDGRQRVGSGSTNGNEKMHFRLGINRWKAIQTLVWAVFAIGWGAVGTSVAVHFHLEDSWSGIAIFAGPLIFLFSFFISCLLQAFRIERT
jgi:hypothetical protein